MTKLTYKQCKELKDAGFPQETLWYFILDGYLEDNKWNLETEEHWNTVDGEWGSCRDMKADMDYVSAPTLSELIEACGEGFIGLDRTDYGWLATGNLPCSVKEGNTTTTINQLVKEVGKTPEEAVKNFYIAIHS